MDRPLNSATSHSSAKFCNYQNIVSALGIFILLISLPSASAFAETSEIDDVANKAQEAWIDGDTNRALDILKQGIQDYPKAPSLQKLRGDVLATSRRNQDAIGDYDAVLQITPEALDVRWAKWSVLLRSGQSDEAIDEFQRIAQQDSQNPLVSRFSRAAKS